MRKNWFLIFPILIFLFTLTLLAGCGEDRYMVYENLDLPDSVTVTVEASAGAYFDIFVSSDYREERDDHGTSFIAHNSELADAFIEKFSQTFPLVDSEAFPLVDPDERHFSVQLKCNQLEPESEEDTGSFRLAVKFNGEGTFDGGTYDNVYFLRSINEPLPILPDVKRDPYFFSLNDLIGVYIIFSRYDGISQEEYNKQ